MRAKLSSERAVKKSLRQEAQDMIMHAVTVVYYKLGDENASPELEAEVRRQVGRIEKMFGYQPGSWKG